MAEVLPVRGLLLIKEEVGLHPRAPHSCPSMSSLSDKTDIHPRKGVYPMRPLGPAQFAQDVQSFVQDITVGA